MTDDYILRRDVDNLKRDVYNLDDGTTNFAPFATDSPLKNIGSTEDNIGTLDGILEHYGVFDGSGGGGGGDLSDYVKKVDLIDKTNYDIDLNLSFGLKGQDDTIVIDMDIVDYVVNKEINLRGV